MFSLRDCVRSVGGFSGCFLCSRLRFVSRFPNEVCSDCFPFESRFSCFFRAVFCAPDQGFPIEVSFEVKVKIEVFVQGFVLRVCFECYWFEVPFRSMFLFEVSK